MYDICVVGAGLVGSAAAKWLSLQQETKVCLVGPQEPSDDERDGGKREVFGSHYDEGRVTRELDEDYVWGLLAKRSIQDYKHIQHQSGINFYNEVGCAFVDHKDSKTMHNLKETAGKLGVEHNVYSQEDFHTKFPYLRIGESCACVLTPHNAGHISPRKLIAAQKEIAKARGCDVINKVVVKVREVSPKDGEGYVSVTTEDGQEIRTRRVLLCTGAFTNFHQLLPRADLKVDINLCKTMVVRAELSREDASRMMDMPCVMLDSERTYVLPPIKYPDGKYYLKLGLWFNLHNEIEDLADAARWFRSRGRYHDATETYRVFRDFFPGVKPLSFVTDGCVASVTPTGQLYCDMATPRVGVLVGMNGLGAKSSNEIGRMGARMISKGSWDYDLPAERFRLRFKNIQSKSLPPSKL